MRLGLCPSTGNDMSMMKKRIKIAINTSTPLCVIKNENPVSLLFVSNTHSHRHYDDDLVVSDIYVDDF